MKRSLALGIFGWAMACVAQAQPMRWEEAFPIQDAPAVVHFRAHYTDQQGKSHSLEVWRDGFSSLHRRTDTAIDLYGVAVAGGETRYRLLDNRRRIAADVTRTNLHRIGVYADPFGLAHVIDPPKEPYQIDAAGPPLGVAARNCAWRTLVRSQSLPHRTWVCWSAAWGLPLLIVDELGAVVFQTDAIDDSKDTVASQPPGTLPALPAGYALVNANQEIDSSAD